MKANAGLAPSVKPDWRGADLANTGILTTTGPITTPAQLWDAAVARTGTTTGVEITAGGNILVNTLVGVVASYTPAGQQRWTYTGAGTGSDTLGPPSQAVAAASGADYVGDDLGNLHQIDDSNGSGRIIWNTPDGSALRQTPKVGPDGTIYIGTGGGVFYHLQPPALGSAGLATELASFTATASSPSSSCPCSFYGEAALDASGNVYVASKDTNPGQGPALGTLYKLTSTLQLAWHAPLSGRPSGAVLLAPNPNTMGQNLVIVADFMPEVVAFDQAGNGTPLWQFQPSALDPANAIYDNTPYWASPALSRDGATLYIPDHGGAFLFGLQVANGQPSTSFGPNHDGVVRMTQGSNSSPIVDASGNVFIESNSGILFALKPDGSTLWTLSRTTTPKLTNLTPGFMSPAIATDGTLYLAGNGAHLQALQASAPATATPTLTVTPGGPTLTATSTATATGTPTVTSTPSSTATATDTGTATRTPTLTATDTQTGTPTSTGTVTQTGTPSPTGSASATDTPTATGTDTPTATGTDTPTATWTSTATNTSTATLTATPSPTGTAVAVGPAIGWSSLRGNSQSSGVSAATVSNQYNVASSWPQQITKGRVFYTAPVFSPDGQTIYQVGGDGRLYALNPDGSTKWHSDAVLGSYHAVKIGGQFTAFDLGSSPAVAADGSIYAASENGDNAGIYRFNPADGSSTHIFSSGTFPGSSLIIGPDGTLYAGSLDGKVYAVNRDGSQKWSASLSCPGSSIFVQSTGALDTSSGTATSGNFYIGYGCSPSRGAQTGGVAAISSTGTVLWQTTYRDAAGNPGGRVTTAVVLSPDGKTVYVRDDGSDLAAIDVASHMAKWVVAGEGNSSQGNLALAPSGDLLYAAIGQSNEQSAVPLHPGLTSFHTSDGSVDHSLSPSEGVPPEGVIGPNENSGPVIDAAGNVIYVYSDRIIAIYSPHLDNTIFKLKNALDPKLLEVSAGPTINTDGSIYFTTKTGTLVRLVNAAPPPSFTPSVTVTPGPTSPPQATYTPVATIVNRGGGGNIGGGNIGGGATNTPSATPSGRNTPSTTGFGGSGQPSAAGSPVPGTNTFSGNGFVLRVVPGVFAAGTLSQFTVQAKAGDKLNYVIKAAYKLTSNGKPLAKSVALYTTLLKPANGRCTGPISLVVDRARSFELRHAVDKSGRDAFCLRVATVPGNALALVVSVQVQVQRGSVVSKASKYSFTLARGLRLVVSAASSQLRPAQTQKVHVQTAPGTLLTYHVTYGSGANGPSAKRTVSASGVDTFSFKVGFTPSRADGIVPASVAVDGVLDGLVRGKARPAFQVVRPDAVLTLSKLTLKVVTPVVHANGFLKVNTVSARAAYLTCTVRYDGKLSKSSYVIVADGSGYATLQFPVATRPAKGKKVSGSVAITAELGKKRVSASARFTVQG